jgi:uncharacterized membrane protein YfcA
VHLETWQWVVLVIGALGVGLSKGGISGLGILPVALFALTMPARESVGVVLLLLICGDVVAVGFYRRHAVWSHLARLFPWAAIGVVLGYAAMGVISNEQVEKLIGSILLVLVFLQLWRNRKAAQQTRQLADDGSMPENAAREEEPVPHNFWLIALTGVVGGFTTMVANAAGPVMVLYLLAMRLPKMEFIGTGAWYFLVLNLFKVPFSYNLGLINWSSLRLDVMLFPCVASGVLVGRWLVKFIDQRTFELMALAFTVVAALRLLL